MRIIGFNDSSKKKLKWLVANIVGYQYSYFCKQNINVNRCTV